MNNMPKSARVWSAATGPTFILRATLLLAVVLAFLLGEPRWARGQATPSSTPIPSAPSVAAIEPAAAAKIEPRVLAEMAAQSKTPLTVIVTLREQADLSGVTAADRAQRQQQVVTRLQATAAQGAQRKAGELAVSTAAADGSITRVVPFWIFNGFSITASPEVIAQIAASPEVASVTSDHIDIVFSDEPAPAQNAPALPGAAVAAAADAPVEPNLAQVNAPAMWALGMRGQGIVVATLDTGVDVTHPELSAKWRGGSNSWYDPYGQNAAPVDVAGSDTGHGTGTMGVLVGGSAGGAAIGAAPEAQWIAAKIIANAGNQTTTGIHLAFQWVLDPDGNPNTPDAPNVVNNSWYSAIGTCDLTFEPDLAALRAAGILPIFAAGNIPNAAPWTSGSPANNPLAFPVGSIDGNNQIASSSSRGPSACPGTPAYFPAVVAPGVGIRTSFAGGGYQSQNGTSFAAPHVAGILANVLSVFPNLTADQQEQALTAGVVDLGAPGADNTYGLGRIDGVLVYRWLIDNGFTPQTGAKLMVNTVEDTTTDNAHCSLRAAVLAANGNVAVGGCPAGTGIDTIVFDPSLPRPLTITLTLTGTNEDAAQTGDLDVTGPLIIDGGHDPAQVIVDGGHADRVIDVLPGANMTLGGVTVSNGAAARGEGGGIRNAGVLILNNAAVASSDGGGILNDGGTAVLFAPRVTGSVNGAGVVNRNSGSLRVVGGDLVGNADLGLLNQGAAATVNRVTAARNAGGIRNEANGSLIIDESTIISNSAALGAGVANVGAGSAAVIGGTRIGLNSGATGGGIYNEGSLSLSQSTIDRNQAQLGGGIAQLSGSMALTNVTVSANMAISDGGGLFVSGAANVMFTTFAGNGAILGGTIYGEQGTITVGSSILSNSSAGGDCVINGGSLISAGYNVEAQASCGLNAAGDMAYADAQIGALQDNGGLTWTHFQAPSSPAIDRTPLGANACGVAIDADQRGSDRPQGTGCDSGAVEYETSADLSVSLSGAAGPVQAGQRITYTQVIFNNGPTGAKKVKAVHQLPAVIEANPTAAGVTYSAPPGGVCNLEGQVVCTLPGLNSKAEAEMAVSFIAPFAGGDLVSVAGVSSTSYDQDMSNNTAAVTLTVDAANAVLTPIHAVQGAAHWSPLDGRQVAVRGVVTALHEDGFWIEDPEPDADVATSEALWVQTDATPTVAVGDEVRVIGMVKERIAVTIGGSKDLTVTSLVAPAVTVLGNSTPLPPPVVLGAAGRLLPDAVIKQTSLGAFNPTTEALDLLESLEGMRVTVPDALVVGPSLPDGRFWVVADGGAMAQPRTVRGGLLRTATDANPERIEVRGNFYPAEGVLPPVAVGDKLGALTGVLEYSQGSYALVISQAPSVDVSGRVAAERAPAGTALGRLTVAVLPLPGLNGTSSAEEFALQAMSLVDGLRSPDIVLLDGMGDDDGQDDSGKTAGSGAFSLFTAVVAQAGGPAYAFRQIDPEDNKDGGPAGLNPRLGLLYNPLRVQMTGVLSTTDAAANVMCTNSQAMLNANPSRLAPTDAAFTNVAKPLVAQFTVGGQQLFVIGVHLVGQAGDSPLYGVDQPPLLPSRAQRKEQAKLIADFVRTLQYCDSSAQVLVVGNLGDALDAETQGMLAGVGLQNLTNLLPENERYTAVEQGNSMALVQLWASAKLASAQPEVRPIHRAAEFPQSTANPVPDPVVARFDAPDLAPKLTDWMWLPTVAK